MVDENEIKTENEKTEGRSFAMMKIHHQQIFQTVFIFDNCKKTAVKATKYLRYYIFFEKKTHRLSRI